MISKVKPLHKKVEETALAIDNAEHKMNVLENKRKVLHVPFLIQSYVVIFQIWCFALAETKTGEVIMDVINDFKTRSLYLM